MLKLLIQAYQNRFSSASINVLFVITALIPAVLFLVAGNYAELKFEGAGVVAYFGGPAALFVFTYWLLSRTHKQMMQSDEPHVTGTVLLDGAPLEGAKIYATGDSRTDTSKAGGYFSLELNKEYSDWILFVKYEKNGETFNLEYPVSQQDLSKPHILKLKKKRRAPTKTSA